MTLTTNRPLKAKCGCGIKAYPNKPAAERALLKVQGLRLRDAMPKRVVQCFHGQWHLEGTNQVDTGPDKNTRDLVKERDHYCCSKCGRSVYGIRASVHHRRNRGDGGSSDPAINSPANLLLVCGTGTTDCHGWIGSNPEEALKLGFVVSLNSDDDPADVPVKHHAYGWTLLRPDGDVWPVLSTGGAA